MAIRHFKQSRMPMLLVIVFCIWFAWRVDVNASEIQEQKNVLIINSYHHSLQWTKDQTDSALEALESSGRDITIFVEYMDWKNHPTNENLSYLQDYLKYKYSNIPIDFLITTDDAALEFTLKNRKELFSDAPIVFAGVNQMSLSKIVTGYKNVTGVVEEVDPEGSINMALHINSAIKNVYLIFDNSESGTSTGNLVMEKIKAMNVDVNTILLDSLAYDDLIEKVRLIEADSIVLCTTYFSDVNGKVVDFDVAAKDISENCSVPVYHLYDIALNNGAFGGSMLSGKHQGSGAAALAIRLMNGENIDDIPIQHLEATEKTFDYLQLQRFDVPLNKLPQDSRIINKPFSFFETYKRLVLSVLAVFILLLTFIGTLLFYIKKIKEIRKELANSHEELVQTYEELTASDEELQQKFGELLVQKELLIKSEERYRLSSEGSNDALWDWDIAGGKMYISERWHEMLGYDYSGNIIDKGVWKEIIHPDDFDNVSRLLQDCLTGQKPEFESEHRLKAKDGSYKFYYVRGKALYNSSGTATRISGSFTDITIRRENELRILRLAYYDHITGLPNRALLEKKIEEALVDSDKSMVLFFIDIDNFKNINDSFGHLFGDTVLADISKRLSAAIGNNAIAARLGGDEFAVLLSGTYSVSQLEDYAELLLKDIYVSITIKDITINLSASIGVAVSPWHGNTLEELHKNADIAMYHAKNHGKNRYALFNLSMRVDLYEKVELESNLRKAIEKNEFVLFYQPLYCLKTKKICGLEALIRWNSPVQGMQLPYKFIPIAEETGLILQIGKWVLRTACNFMNYVNRLRKDKLIISVNVSVHQLLQENFVEDILNIIEETGMEANYLELEITESVLMKNVEENLLKIERLKIKGVRVALDDFGTGYSSFAYLKRLTLSSLKLDKTFIDDIDKNKVDNDITRNIIMLAHTLGLAVVAEGIEFKEQMERLEEYGCDIIQGYYISRPIPAAEIDQFLQQNL